MPPTSEYSRLVTSPRTSESEDVELLPIGDSGWLVSTRPKVQAWLSESTAWNAFTLSLILALAISAVNLTVLSARNTLSRRYDGSAPTAISPPVDYPSVYIGLERVAHDPSQCLNRMTFPNTFYIYDARKGPNVTLTHVHAPEDEVTLVFGGPIRAIMEIHILDFGLENCTFVVQTSKTTHLGSDPSVDVYLLPLNSKPNDGQDGDFLDRLAFIPGRDSISRPFYCPSRSRVLFELRCSEDDCIVQIPLQGVTSKSESSIVLEDSGTDWLIALHTYSGYGWARFGGAREDGIQGGPIPGPGLYCQELKNWEFAARRGLRYNLPW